MRGFFLFRVVTSVALGSAERRQSHQPRCFLSARIVDFALKQRLPSMYAFRDFVDVGGLMSYGANNLDMFRLAADQTARILDGRAPGDVPMLQATRFELIINQRSAKALGISVPAELLKTADRVIG